MDLIDHNKNKIVLIKLFFLTEDKGIKIETVLFKLGVDDDDEDKLDTVLLKLTVVDGKGAVFKV